MQGAAAGEPHADNGSSHSDAPSSLLRHTSKLEAGPFPVADFSYVSETVYGVV
jgi:hypothetical protein